MEKFNIQYFADTDAVAPSSPVTAADGMTRSTDEHISPIGIQKFYNKDLLENARPELYFSQFSKKTALPQGNGKTVQWRKWDTLNTNLTKKGYSLTEGVTPSAEKLSQTEVTSTVTQYGNYVVVTDVLDMTHIDDAVLGASEELGAQAGQVLDKLTRNAIMTGTGVAFPASDTAGTMAGLAQTDIITGKDVALMATRLKKNHAPTINGDYIALIHPSVAYDLRQDSQWLTPHQYVDTEEIYNGEIGKLHGVRFIETTQVAVFQPKDKAGFAVYGCIFFGKDAFGEVDLNGGSLEMIIKPLGSGGSADPLNQRQTIGWKSSHAAEILYQERMFRFVCASTFSTADVGLVDYELPASTT